MIVASRLPARAWQAALALASASTSAASVAHQRTSQVRSYRLRSMISTALQARSANRVPQKSPISSAPAVCSRSVLPSIALRS
jgi:hypothetical protein